MTLDLVITPSSQDEFGLKRPHLILNSTLKEMLEGHAGCTTFERALRHIADGDDLLKALNAYIYFNSVFGSGVANLAGEIAVRQYLFRDAEEPIEIVADRSVEVGAHVFFAAIDEFGGHSTGRGTHRALAQAMIKGIGSFLGYDITTLNRLTEPNAQLLRAVEKVSDGYAVNQKVDEEKIFRALGFHISSEILADQEFNILDHYLRTRHTGLVEYLRIARVVISGIELPPYRWIKIHTTVETDHFNAALEGANLALRYYFGLEDPAQVKEWIITGFKEFMDVQLQFMNSLME